MHSNPLELMPRINFVPKTMDEILNTMITDYEDEFYRQTGTKKSLVASSPERIFLYTEASRIYAGYQMIDHGCKMNLLTYSKEGYLDHLVAMYGLARLPAQKSVCKVEFTLSAPQLSVVVIPKGTRVSTPTKVYFESQVDIIIAVGEQSGRCDIISCDSGKHTSGFLPGQISILVDPVPFVAQVKNTGLSQGGVDIESDTVLALRAYYYSRSLSVAGPEDAYAYFVSTYSQAIEGISVSSPTPGDVDIRITLKGGELPQEPFINALEAYLEDKRPLTDHIKIAPPKIVCYAVSCTFFIGKSDSGRQADIISAVNEAVAAYVQWQGEKIGRDLSPDKLINLAVNAGAKRLEIIAPLFTPVETDSICQNSTIDVTFGGIEHD